MSVLQNKLVPVDYDGNGTTDLGFLRPIAPDGFPSSGVLTAELGAWLLGLSSGRPITQGLIGGPFLYANANLSVLGDGFIPGFAGPVNFFFSGPAPLFPDFNGDGKTDQIFGSLAYGDPSDDSTFLGYELVTWFMDGLTPFFQDFIRTSGGNRVILREEWADPSLYNITGQGPLGDYNGDGKSDFLFLQETSSRLDIALWLMDGNVPIRQDILGSISPTWSLVNTNDFDGNGTTDLVFTQIGSGGELTVGLWLIDGFDYIAQTEIATTSQPGWFIVDSNDFDGNGTADLLLGRSVNNRFEIGLWTMNGTTITGQKGLGSISDAAGWELIDHNDFNGDGKADLLFARTVDGNLELGVWLVDGTNGLIAQQSIGTTQKPDWKVLTTGDATGNGIADIFLVNDVTKEIGIWYLGSNGLPNRQQVIGTYDGLVGWQTPFTQPDFDRPPFPQSLEA